MIVKILEIRKKMPRKNFVDPTLPFFIQIQWYLHLWASKGGGGPPSQYWSLISILYSIISKHSMIKFFDNFFRFERHPTCHIPRKKFIGHPWGWKIILEVALLSICTVKLVLHRHTIFLKLFISKKITLSPEISQNVNFSI